MGWRRNGKIFGGKSVDMENLHEFIVFGDRVSRNLKWFATFLRLTVAPEASRKITESLVDS